MARLSFHHPAWSLARDWPESIKTLAQRLRCMRKKHRAADCQLITPFAAGLGVLSWKNWVAHLHICHTHVLSHTCLRSDKPSSRSQEKCCTVSSADTQRIFDFLVKVGRERWDCLTVRQCFSEGLCGILGISDLWLGLLQQIVMGKRTHYLFNVMGHSMLVLAEVSSGWMALFGSW